MAYLPAVNLPGNCSYCLVDRNAGENFVAGAGPQPVTFDTVTFASSDFVVAPGDSAVDIITPGTYLAIADVYPTSTPLAGGELHAIVGGDEQIFTTGVVIPGIISDNGAGLAFAFFVCVTASSSTPSHVILSASQSDNVDHDLSGDLLIIRLPGNSA